MRICLYNVTASFLDGGLETYSWEVGRALAARGHEVTLLAGALAGNTRPPRHNAIALKTFPFRIEGSWPKLGKRFQRLMERLSFARHALPHLLEAQYDAIVFNKPFDFPALWWARRSGLNAQTVFRSGGREFYTFDRRFASSVDHWLSTSRYNAAQVEAHYGRSVRVVPNGVDVERFRPDVTARSRTRAALGLADNLLVFGSVGRQVGWKGLRLIINALPSLPAHVRYVAAGDGEEQAALKVQAQELKVADRVIFPGRIPHAELPATLNAFDCFVQPSIGEESFGISVVEAMACGLPVLASLNGGLPEIVLPGATGELITVGDETAWTSALVEANASGRDTLRSRGMAGRARVMEHFTWSANARTLETLLMERS
jgi:glycosyltransferase involved in cell wall biosynthesis